MTQYIPTFYSHITKITYNYTESGHGKGAKDEVGTAFKRLLDNVVKYGKGINDYEVLLETLKEKCSKMLISDVTQEEIDDAVNHLPKDLKTIPGTRKFYQLKWTANYPKILRFHSLSCFSCYFDGKCKYFSVEKWNTTCHNPKSLYQKSFLYKM